MEENKRQKEEEVLGDNHHLFILFLESGGDVDQERVLKEWDTGKILESDLGYLKVVEDLKEWRDVCLEHKQHYEDPPLGPEDVLQTWILVKKPYASMEDLEKDLAATMPTREQDMLGKDEDFESVMLIRMCQRPTEEGYGVLKDDRFTVIADLDSDVSEGDLVFLMSEY